MCDQSRRRRNEAPMQTVAKNKTVAGSGMVVVVFTIVNVRTRVLTRDACQQHRASEEEVLAPDYFSRTQFIWTLHINTYSVQPGFVAHLTFSLA